MKGTDSMYASHIRKIPFKKAKSKRYEPFYFKGKKIPSDQVRKRATRAERNKALKYNGSACLICGSKRELEAHHVLKGEDGGRGVYRNLRHLCNEHHQGEFGPHRNQQLMIAIQVMHEEMYGPYYHCDVYDLYMMGLIPNTTEQAYERFMQEEERKARYRNIDVDCSSNAYF